MEKEMTTICDRCKKKASMYMLDWDFCESCYNIAYKTLKDLVKHGSG